MRNSGNNVPNTTPPAKDADGDLRTMNVNSDEMEHMRDLVQNRFSRTPAW